MDFILSKNRRFPLRYGTTRAAGTERTFGSAVASAAVLSLSLLAPTAAHALDGCLVLLCFAAPSWKSIPQCVPPIRQVLRDLARGKAFPTCGLSGAGNSARHAWARAPGTAHPSTPG